MVEGFPGAGLQLMSRVGDFFRVARTEVMQVPVWQDSHATPPRSATRSLGSPGGAPGQLGPQGTPTSFAPSHPGREGPLLNADMLQRMQALEQRAPLLYGNVPERPQSRTDSSSLPQEAIQAEVARQLAGFDQRAQAQELRNQAQDLEIQRLRRQLEEEKAMREQLAREAAASSSAPQAPPQMQVPIPLQVPSSQDAQVHTSSAHQVQDVAAPAAGALRAPAQAAAAAASGFWSNFWSGLQGSHRLPSSATPPGGVGQSYDAAQVNLACSAPNPPSQAENLGLGQIWPQGSGMPQVPQVQGTQVPASPPGGVGTGARYTGARISTRRGWTRCLCTGATGARYTGARISGVGPAACAQVPQVSGVGTQVPHAQVSGPPSQCSSRRSICSKCSALLGQSHDGCLVCRNAAASNHAGAGHAG